MAGGARIMGLTFSTEALDQLTERIGQAGKALDDKLGSDAAKSTIKAALDRVVTDARARVHNITGFLSRSIKSRVTVTADAPTVAEAGVRYKGTKQRYAHLVEGGHGGPHGPAAPHPFWAPAVEATGEEAAEAIEALANEALSDVLDKL